MNELIKVLAIGATQATVGALLSMRARDNFVTGNKLLTKLLKETKASK